MGYEYSQFRAQPQKESPDDEVRTLRRILKQNLPRDGYALSLTMADHVANSEERCREEQV